MQASSCVRPSALPAPGRRAVRPAARGGRLVCCASQLKDRVAVVTGGASGIGEATARLFAKEGAKVVVADLQLDRARQLASELGEGQAFAQHCDVCDEDSIAATVKAAVDKFGSLDIMVNNAGIAWQKKGVDALMENLDTPEFDRLIQIDLRGVALGIKHAARAMKKNAPAGRPGGTIINTASVAGLRVNCTASGDPVLISAGYTAAKHGVVALTELAACELAPHRIRVNAVAPGFVATPLVADLIMGNSAKPQAEVEAELGRMRELSPLGVALTPQDIANGMLFLASDMSRCVNGFVLRIDNGMVVGVAGYVPGLEVGQAQDPAVCTGKASEGLDFSDAAGRAVVRLKQESLNEARSAPRKRPAAGPGSGNGGSGSGSGGAAPQGLSGDQWYSQSAMRAVNQAVGRVIRHRRDYGAIILCDERFRAPNVQRQLSCWLRDQVTVYPNYGAANASLVQFFNHRRRRRARGWWMAASQPCQALPAPPPAAAC